MHGNKLLYFKSCVDIRVDDYIVKSTSAVSFITTTTDLV